MRDPAKIFVENFRTLDSITQYFIPIEKEYCKIDVLLDIYSNLVIPRAIIYCNTNKSIVESGGMMKEHGFRVSIIPDQMNYDKTIKEFLSGTARVLITTD
jgi:superfamily II DNA/RNA helicase